ncbi:MAG: wax ester/triacylglycerol synthase family O-acyltransferase [Planctomycetaceae bacterium]
MHLLPAKDATPTTPLLNSMFPLPLSDFEYYMLLDDRPSHPMVFVMVVDVRGTLLEPPFRESLQDLIQAHPLLNCRVENLARLGWCWIPVESQQSPLEWESVTADAVSKFVPHVRAIDIHKSHGIEVLVKAADSAARIVIWLHHACCDGIASLQLVGELLARYGQKTAGPDTKPPEFTPVDPRKLLQRENYETGEAAAQRQKRSLTRMLGKVSRLLLRAPVMLAASSDISSQTPRESNHELSLDDARNGRHSAIHSAVIPRTTYRALRAVAAQQDVSVNDLFVREMMLQIRRWNHHGGIRFGHRWIRLAIPLSMRTVVHENMPAANVVSYALVTRREQDCDDPDELLRSIHQQTSDVLYNREGIVCLKLFRILRRIPGAMKAFLSFKTVLSTMVFANVGDVRKRFSGRFPLKKGRWIAGNVIVEQIHGVAPVRPNTRAAMSIGDYAGELSLSLRTDGFEISPHDADAFLCEFLCRLHDLIQQAEPSSSDENSDELPD